MAPVLSGCAVRLAGSGGLYPGLAPAGVRNGRLRPGRAPVVNAPGTGVPPRHGATIAAVVAAGVWTVLGGRGVSRRVEWVLRAG